MGREMATRIGWQGLSTGLLLLLLAVPLWAADPAEAESEPATAAELVAAIEGLENEQPNLATREEFVAYLQATSGKLLELAEKLLAANPDAGQRTIALRSKLEALSIQGRLGMAEANEQLLKLAESLADHEDGALAAEAGWQLLANRVRSINQRNREAVSTLLADVTRYADTHPTQKALQLAVAVVRLAENVGLERQAADALTALAKAFGGSDDPRVATYAATLDGMARRLRLVGHPIEIAGTQLNGEPFDLADWKGKVVLIDFWATWCGPCLAELPNVLAAYSAYHDRGFEVVGISLDDDRELLEGFLENNPLPWPTLYSTDPAAAGWKHPLAVRYGVSAIPTVILVNQEGNVVSLNARGEELDRQLEKLLGAVEPPADPKEKPAEQPQPTDGKPQDN